MASAEKHIELFNEARAKPAGCERERFLDEACQGDLQLKEQILSLLQAEAEEGDSDFLKPAAMFRQAVHITEKPGDRIGRYKLLQQLGEGGCGVVYMAEQEEPVRRRVALKVIKLGMDTKSVIARFEAERQALALMEHPNIARVFDAGATETGRPYFVMELVRGIKITSFCDQNKLSTEERLRLFIQVCQAIQHAHQKGIIHRDIKPSNILVTVNDGAFVPKVIDFGIAKAAQGRLTDQTLFTAFEQLIGTPAYMSPEQTVMTSVDIDTRSDIYSLGVLLYELLTGRTPFDQNELVAGGLDKMRHTIREKEPPSPSTRLSTLVDAELATTASHRHTEPPKLIHLLRGDLDWIVMKALEKERTRRYETANGLGMDVQRHLNNEPVIARPPSNFYRFQKLVHRNKILFAACAGVAIAVLLAFIILLSSNVRITRERNEKTLALKEKALALDTAQTSELRAREQLFLALKNQARARRLSRQMGRRLDSLAAVSEASRIRADPDLRDDAIAAMALIDVHGGPKLRVWQTNWVALACDPTYQLYAVLDLQSGLTVRNIADDQEIQRLDIGTPKRGSAVLSFSPDGRFLAKVQEGQIAQVWLLETGELLLSGGAEPVRQPAFSSDSRLIALPDGDSVRCYDLATGTEQHRWRTAGPIHSLQFNPRGRRIAIGYVNQPHISVYDVDNGRETTLLPSGSNAYVTVCWHPEGNRLAVGGSDPRIQIWDVEAKRKLATLEGHVQAVDQLTFHPGGMLLASGSWDGVVRLWDLATGRQEMEIPLSAKLQFSRDGRSLGFFWSGEEAQLLQVTPTDEYFTLENGAHHSFRGYYFCAPSPNNRLLAGAAAEGVHLWDLAGRREVAFLPSRYAMSAVFEPDGRALLTCSEPAGLLRWPIRQSETNGLDVAIGPPRKIELPFAPLRLAWNRDVRTLAIVSETAGRAAVFNPFSESPHTVAVEHPDASFLALSPNAKWLATSGWHSDRVRLWNARSGEMAWEAVVGMQTRVSFTPDCSQLIIARGGEFSFLGVDTLEIKRRLRREVGLYPGDAVFSADGKLMALEMAPGVIHLKEVSTHRTVARLEDPYGDRSTCMTFTPDGTKLIVVALYADAIHVWDLRAIRVRLKNLGLDWDWPEFPPANKLGESRFSFPGRSLKILVVEAENP